MHALIYVFWIVLALALTSSLQAQGLHTNKYDQTDRDANKYYPVELRCRDAQNPETVLFSLTKAGMQARLIRSYDRENTVSLAI